MHTRFTVRSVVTLSALSCIALFAPPPPAHAQVKLDFENLSNPSNGSVNNQSSPVVQNGFTITANSPILFSVAPNAGSLGNYTGSVALLPNPVAGSMLTLTSNDSSLFSLNSLDFANFLPQSTPAARVAIIVSGTRNNNTIVSQAVIHGFNNNLETISFNGAFTSLISVSFREVVVNGTPMGFQLDNIVLNAPAAVPEPGSVALLLGMGCGGAGFLVRRRRQVNGGA